MQLVAQTLSTIVLDSVPKHLSIAQQLEIYTDATWQADFLDINKQAFIPFSRLQDFDYSNAYWLRFQVRNRSAVPLTAYFPLSIPAENSLRRTRIPLFEADFYKVHDDNQKTRTKGGRLSNERKASYTPHKQYLELQLHPNELATYYLRLRYDWREFKTTHHLKPMLISKAELDRRELLYSQDSGQTRHFRFAFLAIALMISLINLAQFCLNRDKAYLMYATYAMGLFLLYFLKYEEALPFDNRFFFGKFFGEYYDYFDILFFQSVFFSQFLFYRYFFHTARDYPFFDQRIALGLRLLVGVFLIDILSYFFFGGHAIFGFIHTLLPLLLLPYILYLIYIAYTIQTRLSAIIVTGSLILILLSSLGIVAQFFSKNLLQQLPAFFHEPDNYSPIGAIIEFILFSVALGYRVGVVESRNMELENAKQIAELRKQLYTNITHEFRTPLTLIISPLQEMIAGRFKGNMQQYQKIMLRNAERLLQLINQLLDLSKLEAGELRVQASESDVVQFTRAIAMSFESLALRKQIDFQLDLSPNPIPAWFDRDKMEKVLTNLLSNAFKFTSEEGRIRVLVRQQEKQVHISVEDNGIGIPAEQLPHIFKRFYQVEQPSMRQLEGSGVGLALTREIVELHGGTIHVQSKENEGSRFDLYFPIDGLQFSAQEKIQATRPTKTVATAKTSLPHIPDFTSNNSRILLVVEDNADVRRYVVEQLQDRYQVLEAEHGKAGLELALTHIPDLIISDVMMPEMDGIELCKRLKQNEKTSHIPIIILTAKADRTDRLEGLQIGADDYLTKPFDSEELQLRATNLVQQRQQLIERFSKIGSVAIRPVKPVSPEEIFLQKAVKIVRERMEDEEFGVVELADALLMSRHQLHRKIKALTDKSPSVFIRSLRLQAAKDLLQQGEYNVSEVAFRLGFNSLAYFSKCFAQEFGQPPSAFIAST